MIYKDCKPITGIYHDGKTITAVYRGAILVWGGRANSCFGNGYWINDAPWINTDGWKNNA